MKKILLFIFIVSIQNVFCEKKLLIDKGVEYMCSLETENLSGKVQKMIHFKQEVINQEIKPKIKYKSKIFNTTGLLLYDEKLEDNGKLHIFDTVIYNSLNQVGELITFFQYDDHLKWSNDHYKFNYDEKNNQITAKLLHRYVNGNFKEFSIEQIITTYDSLQNEIKELRIPNNDTSQTTINKYLYNDFGEYISVTHFTKSKLGESEASEKELYDENRNMIKQEIYYDGKLNYTSEFKYDKNNLKEQLTETSADSIVRVTKFNDKALPIEKQTYKKGSCQKDEFYQYQFDNKNNWIEKKVLSQDIAKGEKEAKLTSIETRVITYFE